MTRCVSIRSRKTDVLTTAAARRAAGLPSPAQPSPRRAGFLPQHIRRSAGLCWLLLMAGPLLALPSPAFPHELRWAAQAEVQTLDPHAQNHPQTQAVLQHVYESLTRYTPHLQLEPALASSWEMLSPLAWRFHIRRGVRFHDGSPLTAEDVIFSLERIQEANSPLSAQFTSIRSVRAAGDFLIEIILDKPAPLLPRHLADARIMSKRWAISNKAAKAQNLKNREESFSARHANGTGPFRVESWTAGQALRLERNPQWWDTGGFPGNLQGFSYQAIASDEARSRALQRGEVDLVTDLPAQRIPAMQDRSRLKVATDIAQRTLLIGMDQGSARLQHGDAGERNPFRDQRVRRAMSLAVDMRTLYRITRGMYRPAGTIIAPGVNGWSPELDQRPPRNLRLARQLMSKAGYAKGFSVTLDCPNNRYAYDQEICKALVPMWARIGIRLRINSQPFASLVPRLETLDSSLWMIGWGSPDNDALHNLLSLAYTRSEKVDGAYNAARISDPQLDRLIDAARFENQPDRRLTLLQQALQIVKDQYYYLPLRHATRSWVMNRRTQLLAPTTERPDMRFVRIKAPRSQQVEQRPHR